jgi:hypothetical protein
VSLELVTCFLTHLELGHLAEAVMQSTAESRLAHRTQGSCGHIKAMIDTGGLIGGPTDRLQEDPRGNAPANRRKWGEGGVSGAMVPPDV